MEDALNKPLLYVYLILIGKTKGDCGEWSQEETYGETLTQLITATLKKKKKNMDEKNTVPRLQLDLVPLLLPNSGNFMNGKCQAFQSLMNSACGSGEFILVQ